MSLINSLYFKVQVDVSLDVIIILRKARLISIRIRVVSHFSIPISLELFTQYIARKIPFLNDILSYIEKQIFEVFRSEIIF